MSKYYGLEEASLLDYNQLVIARCPGWCSTGYQICNWNGEEFYYDDQPNDMFNEDVIAFMPLDEDGEPVKLN
jgi:hypothetical protein